MSDDFSDRPEPPTEGAGADRRAASWTIPGMPEDVAVEAEREALRRGLTLGAWLEEVIRHALQIENAAADAAQETGSGVGHDGET